MLNYSFKGEKLVSFVSKCVCVLMPLIAVSYLSVSLSAFAEKWTDLQHDQPEWTLGGQHPG